MKLTYIMVTVFLIACGGGTKFSGSNGAKKSEDQKVETQQTGSEGEEIDKPMIANGGPEDEKVAIESAKDPAAKQETLMDVPENAVTKGSFTVFTIPADPNVRQDYDVIVQIQLPSNINRYVAEDLSGSVNGTDDWQQNIRHSYEKTVFDPIGNGKFPPFEESVGFRVISGELPIKNNVATLRITVPGAERLVKDTIQVKSDLLAEEQEIVIIF